MSKFGRVSPFPLKPRASLLGDGRGLKGFADLANDPSRGDVCLIVGIGARCRVAYVYDGDGHRTQIRKFVSGNGTPTETWDFRYQGDAIVEERLNGAVQRTYLVDEAGAIVKVTIPSGGSAGTYLVTWNGHGDALGLWKIEATGALTLANSYTYTTWGVPATATHNGIPDLAFRFLYVGQHDVQWDNIYALSLHYMHARHFAPTLARFLQPDPVQAEENLYAYVENGPVTYADPAGTVKPIKPNAGGVPSGGTRAGSNATAGASTRLTGPTINGIRMSPLNQWNFRANLGRLTGRTPSSSVAQAHHVFPIKFQSRFNARGINIHDPRYGVWWSRPSHGISATQYNSRWERFFLTNPSRSEILRFGQTLMRQYGYRTNY